MFGWRVPSPDEVMLISGGKQKERDGVIVPFRPVFGHGAFVLPVFRKASFLTLSMQEAVIEENCVTQQGPALGVKAVIAFKVGATPEAVVAAAQRFLADQTHMSNLSGQIFAGHLRSIVGSMTVEDIIKERQRLAQEVLEASKAEMANLGLVVDSLQIQSIDDKGQGYIAAMAAPHQARIAQAAKIAQAEADRAAAEAQQKSIAAQAAYQRDAAIATSQAQAQSEAAKQKAAQAGPLAAAQAQQEVLVEQAKVAQRNAELVDAQLVADVINPAKADAEAVRIKAQADADATLLSAKAAAGNGRIALDQQLIDQLPQLVEAAGTALAGANVTVLNGTDGLGEAMATIAAQGVGLLGTIREGLFRAVPALADDTVYDEEPEPAPPARRARRRQLPAGDGE